MPWETIREGNDLWVMIHDHPVPSGYNREFANIAIKIEAGYPDSVVSQLQRRRPLPYSGQLDRPGGH